MTSASAHDVADTVAAFRMTTPTNPSYINMVSWPFDKTSIRSNWNAGAVHEDAYQYVLSRESLDGVYKPAYWLNNRYDSSRGLGTVLLEPECYEAWTWNQLYEWGAEGYQSCTNSTSGSGGGRITMTSDRNGAAYVRVYNGSSGTIENVQLQYCGGSPGTLIGDGTTFPNEIEVQAFYSVHGCYWLVYTDPAIRVFQLDID